MGPETPYFVGFFAALKKSHVYEKKHLRSVSLLRKHPFTGGAEMHQR